MSDDTTAGRSTMQTWMVVILILLLFFAMYFGAPVLLVAPVVWITGDEPPDWVLYAFLPITLLYDKSETYARYLDWQGELFGLD